MLQPHTFKFQRFLSFETLCLFLLVFLFPLKSWGSQEAIVVASRAVIYSDKEMTSPLGYVKQGKKITVGEIPRNKAQVYPIIVSGKLGYIRVIDVSTERESMDSNRLVAERFQQSTLQKLSVKYVLSYYSYSSQISLSDQNDVIADGDSLRWNGVSLKGELLLQNGWDIQILGNYMETDLGRETFRIFELGGGGAYRLINKRSFLLRLEGQLMAVPFSSYSLGSDFRVNGYGLSAGGGVNGTYLFGKNWGVEAFAGLYYTKLFGYDVPRPYSSISPSFYGSRIGLGLNYSY